MNLKSIKPNQNFFIITALFLFFFLLRHNQIFYQFKFFFDDQNFFYSVINYLNFYIDNQNLLEIFIYISLLIPGYILIKSKFNFENTSIFFLYLFFFAPFIIFFSILDDNFYSVLSNKKILLTQKNLYILSSLLYINLILLIFFSKLDFKIKMKYFYIKIRNLKIVILSVIIFFFVVVLFDLYHLNNELKILGKKKINIDLSYLMVQGTDYRNLIHGPTGYLYYLTLYVFLPLLYLIEKKTGNLLLVTFIYLLSYFLFKHKITLFFTITIILYHYKSSFFLERFYFRILKIILIYLITTFIYSYLVDHFFKVQTSFFFERFFLSQTKNLFLVYDYLIINGPIYLSHISILNKSFLLPVDTINPIIQYEGNFFDLLRDIYGGGSAVSNSYIMDGLASFGLKGLFFISILLTVLFKLIDSIIEFKKNDFQLIYLYQIIGFLSFPLSTHLLTYGLATSIFLGMIRLKA